MKELRIGKVTCYYGFNGYKYNQGIPNEVEPFYSNIDILKFHWKKTEDNFHFRVVFCNLTMSFIRRLNLTDKK